MGDLRPIYCCFDTEDDDTTIEFWGTLFSNKESCIYGNHSKHTCKNLDVKFTLLLCFPCFLSLAALIRAALEDSYMIA